MRCNYRFGALCSDLISALMQCRHRSKNSQGGFGPVVHVEDSSDSISDPTSGPSETDPDGLRHLIEYVAHYLPAQGPITVFVHHNTLHAFEHLGFDEGVQEGGRVFGCHPYLPEDRYREKLKRDRIRVADLDAVLLEDLGDEADRLVANFGTRYALRLAMLEFPLVSGSTAELRWLVAETDALRKFRTDVDITVRDQMISQTREWVLRHSRTDDPTLDCADGDVFGDILQQFDRRSMDSWSDKTWEAFVLNYLWRVCRNRIRQASVRDAKPTQDTAKQDTAKQDTAKQDTATQDTAKQDGGKQEGGKQEAAQESKRRHRDLLFEATGEDPDLLVHDVLIKFCSAFLDQGFADWELPDRDTGIFGSFFKLHGKSLAAPTRWYADLRNEARRIVAAEQTPLASIQESLNLLGVDPLERESFFTQSLLALRGWAGMVWQLETNAEWTPHPAPAGSLVEFLAVRLVLDRVALRHVARETLGFDGPLTSFRKQYDRGAVESIRESLDQRGFTVFQLAQVRGWHPHNLQLLSTQQWQTLTREIEAFPSIERRRIYHRAFERKYRNETLDGVIAHSSRLTRQLTRAQGESASAANDPSSRPAFQIICCIDEREESFRRHLEEVQPDCETFGFAGFFGVAMYYRGAEDAHFTPLCPVNVKPRHYVVEQPLYSAAEVERRRAETRRRLGHATHQAHLGTRTFWGGVLVGLFGSLAAFPLVARILFPRMTSQIRRMFSSIVHTPNTELRLERIDEEPGPSNGQIGYSVAEMADIVQGALQGIGLAKTELFSQLVVVCGHGSSSLNNPHEAAHDCGACGGGRGGPNARAFAQMANDVRVRRILAARQILIPDDTLFVGGYHNTCDDSMSWYDLDRVPLSHRSLFESAQLDIDEARKRSSHERCRRFASSNSSAGFEDALRHVEGRSEDLSQTRPEYGHATNALCFVGRRAWSRGLFLDRRAFLTSYDPKSDDERSSTLERLLQAVIPVCAGISLEYYFSYVDPTGYGCGTKLPHNITSLVGVMDGAASDLRPGLPWQMVEIHEPVRLLFVIEATPETLLRIIEDNEGIAQLVRGDWVQLAVFDSETSHVHRYVRGEFVLYAPEVRELDIVTSSTQWYRGHDKHLGFVSIEAASPSPNLANSSDFANSSNTSTTVGAKST
jgi:uncharacterized protein